MTTLSEIDCEIRRLTGEAELSRPFRCRGSPLGCLIAEVGINPGTDTPFWPYWDVENGCDKNGWIAHYLGQHRRFKPTRDRIEILCKALEPIRCLELNLYHRFSKSKKALSKEHHDTALFDFMLKVVKPRVLIVHGDDPISHLSQVLRVGIAKDCFTPACYLGMPIDVFASKKHFAYVSRDYVTSVARLIADHVRELE